MKKRWCIGVVLLFGIIVVAVAVVFAMKNNEPKQNQSNDVIKISENLYYKSLDENRVICDEDSGQRVSNELIIYTDDSDKNIIETLIKEENGNIVGYIDITNTYQVEFDDRITTDELLAKKNNLEKNEHIERVFYNHVVPVNAYSAFYPNDEIWKNQWDTMEAGNWGLRAMHVPEAWDYIKNTQEDLPEIQMGILDVGPLDSNHKDLKENLGEIIGFADDENLSDAAHGTQVSGIIGAEYDNREGITGVMMNNEKINYFSHSKAREDGKETVMAYLMGLSFLIELVGDNQTAILNLSLGNDEYLLGATMGLNDVTAGADDANRTIANHLKKMLSEGYDFLIVKAAGNASNMPFLRVDVDANDENTWYHYVPYIDSKEKEDKQDIYKKYSYLYKKYKKQLSERIYQGDVDASKDIFCGITDEEIESRIIVVGGLDKTEDNDYPLYFYSSKGKRIDIVAPATHIESTSSGNSYAQDLNGTSFATPYVSGIAGLMLTVNPDLSGEELKEILKETGSGKYNFGMNGSLHEVPLVDAYEAVKRADHYGEDEVVDESEVDDISSQFYGTWLQLDSDDPVVLTLKEDRTLQYYNSISYENVYNSTFEWNKGLQLNLLGLATLDMVPVPYRIEIDETKNPSQMTLAIDSTQSLPDTTKLYGMEKVLEGTYERLSFSNEQLEAIKSSLGVPGGIEVEIIQNVPYYWEAGERWLTQVDIYDKNNQYLAGAAFDSKTMEICKNIYMYAGF